RSPWAGKKALEYAAAAGPTKTPRLISACTTLWPTTRSGEVFDMVSAQFISLGHKQAERTLARCRAVPCAERQLQLLRAVLRSTEVDDLVGLVETEELVRSIHREDEPHVAPVTLEGSHQGLDVESQPLEERVVLLGRQRLQHRLQAADKDR